MIDLAEVAKQSRVAARINKINRGIRMHKKYKKELQYRNTEDWLKERYREGDHAGVFQAARKLGGKNRGPKRRAMGRLPEDQISTEQWEEYANRPGKEGGYDAQIMSRAVHDKMYRTQAEVMTGGDDWQARSIKDMEAMQGCIKAMGNRKATRKGEAPAEMSKMLICKRQKTEGEN